MVLTYQEAVEAGARVLYAHDRVPGDDAWPEWDILVAGSTGQQWQAIGQRDAIRAVLSAVGYADLLAEVDRLHSWAGLMELLDEHWPADIWPMLEDDLKADAGHRVTSAMRWIDRLRTERDALAATVARVEVLRVQSMRTYSTRPRAYAIYAIGADALDAALHPKGTD